MMKPQMAFPEVVVSSHSISVWIERLRASDPRAAQALWERFFERMVRLARQRLGTAPRGAADEEDVALSAFLALHQGIRAGRFPCLNDRGDLWNVLFTLTVRKAASLVRHETRLKRGGAGAGAAALVNAEPSDDGPTPDEAAVLSEEVERLLGMLPDQQLRQIALARLEGCDNVEIARRIGCSSATIERRLRLIRTLWANEPGASDP
jgi:RNA polymerase sigma factor (sigma-70 family)